MIIGSRWGADSHGNQTGDSTGTAAVYNDRHQVTSITPAGATARSYTYAGGDNRDRLADNSLGFTPTTLGLAAMQTPTGDVGFTRMPDGTLLARRTSAGWQAYLTDIRGSVTAMVDQAGATVAAYTYGPYGSIETATGTLANRVTQPYRYLGAIGYHHDQATGLDKLGHRYMNTATGRFTQPDPSGQEANLYHYAGCNPVIAVDPNGSFPLLETVTGIAAGAIASAVAGAVSGGNLVIAGIVGGCVTGAVTS